MLSGYFKGNVSKDDALWLLSCIMRNVRKTDDYIHWIGYDSWDDAHVYRALEKIYNLLDNTSETLFEDAQCSGNAQDS